jgi:hypothetical protein
MKRILSLAVIALTTVFCIPQSSAQMPYNVTTLNEAYTPLTNATNVTAGRLWSDTSDFEIPVGFSFQLGNSIISSLHFLQTNVLVSGDNGVQSGFAILGTSLQDRGFNSAQPVSPIQYKVSGAAGSRIFKLEIKNAGFYNEWDKFQTADDSINLQVWIYESNSAFEFRFGPSSITHFADYFDSVPLGYFKNLNLNVYSFEKFYCLKGNPTAPGMDTLTSLNKPEGFTTYPSSGMVYRFTPKGGTTGISDRNAVKLGKIYPVPAQDVLYVETKAEAYEIFSLTGSLMAKGKLIADRQAIALQDLSPGMYMIRLSQGSQTDIQKFIKQ